MMRSFWNHDKWILKTQKMMFIYYLHFPEDKYNCSKSENLQEQATKISAIDKVPPEILPSYYIIF